VGVAFSGDRLATARSAAGLNQTQLAEILGVDPGRVREWERGLYAPRPSAIPTIAAAVRIDALELVGADADAPELESLRLAAGLSLQAIAAAAGTSVPRYRRLELGITRADPPQELVERLARVLAVPPVTIRASLDIARANSRPSR